MIRICCPSCAEAYELADGSIGPEGRKVRCSACNAVWLAHAEEAEEPEAAPAVPEAASARATDTEAPLFEVPAETRRPPRRPWHERISTKARAPRARWPYAAALCTCVALGALVGLRKSVVAQVPEAGRVYAALGLPVNLSGLALREVRSGIFTEGGTELLVVQGEIANVSAAQRSVPRLKFTIRDGKGVEIYSWTAQADAKDLKPGESQTFRRRLASPPPEGAEVLVRFATRADLIAMAK